MRAVRRKSPVANGLAPGTLLGSGIAAAGAKAVVHENAGHWGWIRAVTSCFEICADLKILRGRVLHQVEQSHGNYENGEYKLNEPI